jgi:hypothetical protein
MLSSGVWAATIAANSDRHTSDIWSSAQAGGWSTGDMTWIRVNCSTQRTPA